MTHPAKDRHGEGVKAMRKIDVGCRRATVWRDGQGRYAVTFDVDKTSVPPVRFEEYYSQAVAIHVFKGAHGC
jgi:hypothetical protein